MPRPVRIATDFVFLEFRSVQAFQLGLSHGKPIRGWQVAEAGSAPSILSAQSAEVDKPVRKWKGEYISGRVGAPFFSPEGVPCKG